jgi:hypothetical protein
MSKARVKIVLHAYASDNLSLFEACREKLQLWPGYEVSLTRTRPRCAEDEQWDGSLSIRGERLTADYHCEAKRRLDAGQLSVVCAQLRGRTHDRHRPLLITDYVNPRAGERLREEGIEYLDAAGNAFLNAPPLYVWLNGSKPREMPAGASRLLETSGLRVVAMLLSRPDGVNMPYRALAAAAGVSIGSVSRIFADLRSAGFLTLAGPGTQALVERKRLFEEWELGYASRLRPKLRPRTYRPLGGSPLTELPHRVPLDLRPDLQVGGEVAAAWMTDHLRPATLTLHVPRDRQLAPLLNALRLVPDPQGPITFIDQIGTQTRWLAEPEAATTTTTPLPVAPPPLVHAELLCVGRDGRLEETARMIFDAAIHGQLKP